MTSLKKYGVVFVVEFLIFFCVLSLFNWESLDPNKVFSNLFQGMLFGLFLTSYHYWNNKQKEKKEKNEVE